MYKIENVETLTLGTTAQTVKVMGLSCLIDAPFAHLLRHLP